MKRASKIWWTGRLAEYPFLRVLLCDLRFRRSFIAISLLVFLLVLAQLRLWTTSPDGVLPVVRVSGIDLAQAWSLKRTASKAMESGRSDEADLAWKLAFANNPADVTSVRGMLRALLRGERRDTEASSAYLYSGWFLRLTGTNLVDLELAATVFERYGFLDHLVSLLKPREHQLTETLEAIFLKALFNQRDIDAFGSRWRKVGDRLRQNTELALYHSAYLAGWGPSETRASALKKLEAALTQPERKVLAARLQMSVAARLMDTDRYRRCLRLLEEWKVDTLLDRMVLWRLLAQGGSKVEAARLAQSSGRSPTSGSEAVFLAQVLVEIGLRDQALRVLERSISQFAHLPQIWITYGEELIRSEGWDELRKLAFEIRGREQVQDLLAAYSFYLEGRAELGVERVFGAGAAFAKLVDQEVKPPDLGLRIANSLLRLGYADIALGVLLRLEEPLASDVAYWASLFEAADHLKRVDLMVKAGATAYRLKPNDPVLMNNYAAALLIARQNPGEAITVTLRLYLENPRSLVATVNHAWALVLNRRVQEAEALLKTVAPADLSPTQKPQYFLALFDVHRCLGRFDTAWAVSLLIKTDFLYPPQQQWLRSAKEGLERSPASRRETL